MAQSQHAKNTINPIRKIADSMSVACNPGKEPIRLNLGDPTVVGNLPPSAATLAAVEEALHSRRADGYGPSVGTLEARTAVAQHFGSVEHPIAVDDIVLTSGASHALDLAITAIADPGDNILVPAPGFPLYQTLCRPNGIEAREYGLRMNDGGLVDLHALEAAIDARTRAIIINNPGNPTGVVFPRAHLEAILEIASRNKVPIIADEIYGDLVYDGAVFFPMHTLSPRVPIITVDGIAKRWLVPGYRLGWLVVHDFHNVLADVLRGMIALSQKIVGPCALVQAALPKILRDTPADFFEHTKDVISRNAAAAQRVLSRVPGLKTLKPQGAMCKLIASLAKVCRLFIRIIFFCRHDGRLRSGNVQLHRDGIHTRPHRRRIRLLPAGLRLQFAQLVPARPHISRGNNANCLRAHRRLLPATRRARQLSCAAHWLNAARRRL